jgi:eukaryotic-like serine/threonine-protein kinase
MTRLSPRLLNMNQLHAGDQLDRYHIDELVARSGMASIFRATDLDSGQPVAIKVPHPEMESDPLFYDRFKREENIGQKMDHPGVMKVLKAAGPTSENQRSQVYMVMEWVPGRLLRNLLSEETSLPPARAARLTGEILDALDYIHRHGVVHRDLKPENIMVVPPDSQHPEERVKLIDFGLAGQQGARRLTFAKLTQVMGTPNYISPEQVKGSRGDARSDIYSVGVMLYEMLTGKTPFDGPNPFAIMNDRLLNNPVPPRELDPSISPQLQEIVYRAMERDPRNRYPSAREFARDLAHPEQVGVEDRPELTDWKNRRRPWPRTALLYAGFALIPILLFGLLIWAANR